MSNFNVSTFTKKNKNGKVIENIMNFQPKKGHITIQELNNTYKKLRTKINPKNIMIKIQTTEGFLTAKSFDYVDEDIELMIENYFNSLSQEGQDKFKQLLSFQIITK